MTEGAGRDTKAVEEYWRALRSAQRDESVAEAEDVLNRAWATELEEVRRATLQAAATAQTAYMAARTLVVRTRQNAGSHHELAEASERLREAEAEHRRSVDAANSLLNAVDGEFELICSAAQEREVLSQNNRMQVRSAWKAAYGASVPGRPEAEGRGGSGAGERARPPRPEGREGLFWVEEPEDPE